MAESVKTDNKIDAGDLAHLTSTDLRRLLDAIARLAVEVPRPEPKQKPSPRAFAAAARPLAIAERRQVTTLFCDLVGYTRLSSDFDPEIVLELLTSYKDLCAKLMERYGGYVLRYIGDRVLETFGYPRARRRRGACGRHRADARRGDRRARHTRRYCRNQQPGSASGLSGGTGSAPGTS